MFFIHHVQIHLELEVGDGGYQVAVAAPLPDAVDRTLHVRRTGLDRRQGVRHAAAGVVVGVDADLDLRKFLHPCG